MKAARLPFGSLDARWQVALLLSPVFLLLAVCMAIPLTVMLVYSFWQSKSFVLVKDLTWANYDYILSSGTYLALTGKSVGYGVLVTLVTIIIPRSIVGISMLVTLSYFGIPRSMLTIVLGQIFYVLPFVVIAIVSVIIVFDHRLEEAALDLGAGPWTTFRRVTLPLILNGIATGAAVAFILSFSEFTLSYYLAGERQTLPIYIFSEFKFLITPKINTLSTAIVTLVVAVTLLAEYVRRKGTRWRNE